MNNKLEMEIRRIINEIKKQDEEIDYLELDSLEIMSVIVEIEDRFHIEFDQNDLDIEKLSSFKYLAKTTKKYMG